AEPPAPYGAQARADDTAPQAETQSQKAELMKLTKEQLRKEIRDRQRKMQTAAKELDFMSAAKYRDEIKEMQSLLDSAR
ncbi:MAG: UvrB/UvrC motif-containing protein, partial [Bacteroidales bacterium]|nr:UvrB/UvrC motif-containing protein [Bacteroidales bacterium]